MRMRKGFTLVEIMIVVGIIALLAAIAIPNLLRSRITSAEANAQATLKTIATACENYASGNNGNYPSGATNLTTDSNPPYLNSDYLDGVTRNGYNYTASLLDSTGYTITANTQGSFVGKARNYTISTGSNMTGGSL